MNIENIHILRLAAAYVLLIFPLAVILWYRLGIAGRMMLAVVRMTVQLLFVGFYLQVLFEVNSPWLNVAWVLVMIFVADISIVRGCGLTLKRFIIPIFLVRVVDLITVVFSKTKGITITIVIRISRAWVTGITELVTITVLLELIVSPYTVVASIPDSVKIIIVLVRICVCWTVIILIENAVTIAVGRKKTDVSRQSSCR